MQKNTLKYCGILSLVLIFLSLLKPTESYQVGCHSELVLMCDQPAYCGDLTLWYGRPPTFDHRPPGPGVTNCDIGGNTVSVCRQDKLYICFPIRDEVNLTGRALAPFHDIPGSALWDTSTNPPTPTNLNREVNGVRVPLVYTNISASEIYVPEDGHLVINTWGALINSYLDNYYLNLRLVSQGRGILVMQEARLWDHEDYLGYYPFGSEEYTHYFQYARDLSIINMDYMEEVACSDPSHLTYGMCRTKHGRVQFVIVGASLGGGLAESAFFGRADHSIDPVSHFERRVDSFIGLDSSRWMFQIEEAEGGLPVPTMQHNSQLVEMTQNGHLEVELNSNKNFFSIFYNGSSVGMYDWPSEYPETVALFYPEIIYVSHAMLAYTFECKVGQVFMEYYSSEVFLDDFCYISDTDPAVELLTDQVFTLSDRLLAWRSVRDTDAKHKLKPNYMCDEAEGKYSVYTGKDTHEFVGDHVYSILDTKEFVVDWLIENTPPAVYEYTIPNIDQYFHVVCNCTLVISRCY